MKLPRGFAVLALPFLVLYALGFVYMMTQLNGQKLFSNPTTVIITIWGITPAFLGTIPLLIPALREWLVIEIYSLLTAICTSAAFLIIAFGFININSSEDAWLVLIIIPGLLAVFILGALFAAFALRE